MLRFHIIAPLAILKCAAIASINISKGEETEASFANVADITTLNFRLSSEQTVSNHGTLLNIMEAL